MTAEDNERSLTQQHDLAAQRAQWRRELLARRRAMPPCERAAADRAINDSLALYLRDLDGIVGFYWPIQQEFDARPALTDWLACGRGRRAVLPVVTRRAAPLEFRQWTPDSAMLSAGFGTSVPADGAWLVPEVLLIPLVGFDQAHYRLGYGGGYYDRSIASLASTGSRPDCTGIGYAICALPGIEPQSYDLKLDRLIVG